MHSEGDDHDPVVVLRMHNKQTYDPSAANHICQSNRGWCGATQEGETSVAPGLYLIGQNDGFEFVISAFAY